MSQLPPPVQDEVFAESTTLVDETQSPITEGGSGTPQPSPAAEGGLDDTDKDLEEDEFITLGAGKGAGEGAGAAAAAAVWDGLSDEYDDVRGELLHGGGDTRGVGQTWSPALDVEHVTLDQKCLGRTPAKPKAPNIQGIQTIEVLRSGIEKSPQLFRV